MKAFTLLDFLIVAMLIFLIQHLNKTETHFVLSFTHNILMRNCAFIHSVQF